jgi:hypothetical protein
MGEKKVVNRNVAIALGSINIIFLIGLVGAIVNYTSIINNKDSQINSLNVQIKNLQSKVVDLESQINTLMAPKLVFVNMKYDDIRPWFGAPYLHVYGEVCNVGTKTAYNSKIHVVAYQRGVVAIDTYIVLGTISGESWTHVDSNIYYSGGALTNVILTLECTG